MGVKTVKRRLSIQFEVGVTPSGRTAKASFSILRLKEGVSEEKVRSVVAEIAEIMDCPVLGARIVEVITHEILGPVVHAREDEGEEVLTSLEGKRRVQEETTVGAVQSGVQESGVRMQQTRVGVPELPALMRLPVQSPLGLDAYPFKPSTKPGVLWERGADGDRTRGLHTIDLEMLEPICST